MTADGSPRRRAMDRDKWTDERLDDFARMIGPAAGMAAQHEGQIDALRDSLSRMERDAKERFDRAFEKLDRIQAHVERTNGRVTDLEKVNAVEEALRVAAAAAVEERRKTIALHLAQHGWVAPTLAGGAMGLIVALVSRFT